MPKPATVGQLDLITQLMEERDHPPLGGEPLTRLEASAVIAQLKLAPLRSDRLLVNRNGAGPGVYRPISGSITRLKPNVGRTHLYAVVLDPIACRWDYVPGAAHDVLPEDALTAEVAAEYGLTHGVCALCGTRLTDPDSIARGVGPNCYRSLPSRAR